MKKLKYCENPKISKLYLAVDGVICKQKHEAQPSGISCGNVQHSPVTVALFIARDTVTASAPPLLRFARSSTRIRSLSMTRAYKQMQCPMRQKGDVKKRSFFTSPEGNNFIPFEELSAEVQKPKHQTKASCFCSCVCERTSVCACSCSESSASRAFASMSFTLFS